jgi:hypothetical protein
VHERLVQRLVGVAQVHVLADDAIDTVPLRALEALDDALPAREVGLRAQMLSRSHSFSSSFSACSTSGSS